MININIPIVFSNSILKIDPKNAFKSPISTGTKVMLTNFAVSVTEKDLNDLFSAVGPIKSCELDYDKEGKSKGTGTVIFVNHSDAIKSIEEYQDRELDGKEMKLHIISSGISNNDNNNSVFNRITKYYFLI